MSQTVTRLKRLRFYLSVSTIYVLTLGFLWQVARPADLMLHSRPISLTRAEQVPHFPHRDHLIDGRPIRIVIPASHIDLPTYPGYYDSATNSWSLSGYRAQFAMISTLANNLGGDTFIYGHNNNDVFGALRHNTPATGAQALLYTDNGHVFSYVFATAKSLNPDDVSALSYEGPPRLTIQTCTGSFNEWRTLYRFNFEKVIR